MSFSNRASTNSSANSSNSNNNGNNNGNNSGNNSGNSKRSIKEMTQILGYLYLGGKTDAKSKESLTKKNIKYILNCTPKRSDDRDFGCNNFYEKENLFKYKRIPIFDNRGEDILAHMETAYQFIEGSNTLFVVLILIQIVVCLLSITVNDRNY